MTSPRNSFEKRSQSRLVAIQALFQISQTGAGPSEIITEFLDYRLGNKKKRIETTFFAKLVTGAWDFHIKADEILTGCLKTGWTPDRLESVLRIIFYAAIYEISHTKTPPAALINEYLNLTRMFTNESEVPFVNGVLDTLVRRIRPTEELSHES